jgi:hypothetical protein
MESDQALSRIIGASLNPQPSVIDALNLPENLHSPAVLLLNQIEAGESVSEVERYYNRADGFVWGLRAARVVNESEAGYLWLHYERAQLERVSQFKAGRIA